MKEQKADKNSFKSIAKEAKHRMKTGYWSDFDKELNEKIDCAEAGGGNPSKVAEYYINKTIREVNGKKYEDELFYEKVCNLLDTFGEVSDAIGRLVDHDVYDGLDYAQKQRYMLELSNRYLLALERYRKEKEFNYLQSNKVNG